MNREQELFSQQPAQETGPKAMGTLLIVSGPSASGKDSVVQALVKDGEFTRALSMTNRAPRPGEDPNSYIWKPEKKDWTDTIFPNFYDGHNYGTPKEAFALLFRGKSIVLNVDLSVLPSISEIFSIHFPTQAEEMLNHLKILVIMPPSPIHPILRERFLRRIGITPNDANPSAEQKAGLQRFSKRIRADAAAMRAIQEHTMPYISHNASAQKQKIGIGPMIHVIVNHDLKEAIQECKAVLKSTQ